jgi:hypothetical protein
MANSAVIPQVLRDEMGPKVLNWLNVLLGVDMFFGAGNVDEVIRLYVREVEHQDGPEYWENFNNPEEAVEDFMRFVGSRLYFFREMGNSQY